MQEEKRVSLDEIREAFVNDRRMYLTGELAEPFAFTLQIYHSEDEDADEDVCALLLLVGEDEDGSPAICLGSGDDYMLDEIVRRFQLDPYRSMWWVDWDVTFTH